MLALFFRLKDKSYLPTGKYFSTSALAISSSSALTAKTATAKAAAGAAMQGPQRWFVLASLLSYCFVTHYNVRKKP